ncbi:DUF1097 domain-containing protein [Bradyrhizobium sp.]|uniref:DUF1097 domain-containing protein n=1 Tax=Bradyrhizobium sp. TaxID=376 RepID=UPI001D2AF2C6|nr:DUF1097 domain-containing protein [Bradyrhizobium sp.]MBV8697234.1 DUF1097 domain-containing protein [Bradyrhizobium sp.]MBV8919518.1 DUF1097 domain-containing protein [Bradyrhizobium sp.]
MVIEMNLSSLTAAALAAALVAAASVLAFSAMPGLFVWAAFIGWASCDHSGATLQAALRSSAALIFGVVMAWVVAVVVAAGVLPLSAPLATAVTAGVASFLIVLAAAEPILSIVPAAFYGFASTFAYLSLVPGAFTLKAMMGLDWENVIVAMPLSLLIGTGLGIAQGWLASVLAASKARAAPARALRLDGSPVGDGNTLKAR